MVDDSKNSRRISIMLVTAWYFQFLNVNDNSSILSCPQINWLAWQRTNRRVAGAEVSTNIEKNHAHLVMQWGYKTPKFYDKWNMHFWFTCERNVCVREAVTFQNWLFFTVLENEFWPSSPSFYSYSTLFRISGDKFLFVLMINLEFFFLHCFIVKYNLNMEENMQHKFLLGN